MRNLIKERFGKLVVLSKAGKNKGSQVLWLCQCDCGNTKKVIGYSLTHNITKSCGCHRAYGMNGENNHNWQGGRHIDPKGYVRITLGKGVRKFEHVLIAEKVLGRRLKHRKELVHHINGNKSDNRNGNLLICSYKYHGELHQKMSLLYMKEHFG